MLGLASALGALALSTVLTESRIAALDATAEARAAAIAELAAHDRLPVALPVAEPGEIAQLLDAAGTVVASSPNASRTLPLVSGEELEQLRAMAIEGADSGPVAGLASWTGSTSASPYNATARIAVAIVPYDDDSVTIVVTLPLEEVDAVAGGLRLALLVVVPVLTLLWGGVIWFALGRALDPVERLRRGAISVAGSGRGDRLPEPTRDDEIGALARTLNEMLERIEAAATRQRTFVADAAHELRSPLASMRAAVEVSIEHPAAFPPEEMTGQVHDEVLRMQHLVDDLLVLARVGSAPLGREELALADVAHDALALTHDEDPDRVTVEVLDTGRAIGDRAAALRVVRNLVDNAIRHARGRVRVRVTDGSVIVEDDGDGIPAHDRERAFERFTRLQDARERPVGGTGLGLAIARETARELGGDVTLGESALGGLLARVTLPLS